MLVGAECGSRFDSIGVGAYMFVFVSYWRIARFTQFVYALFGFGGVAWEALGAVVGGLAFEGLKLRLLFRDGGGVVFDECWATKGRDECRGNYG